MAEALIKYETIDEKQIRDIMQGRTPQPPADWDEPSEPGQVRKVVEPEPANAKSPAPPLGGPAGQH
jgi:cell division protease FtsH